ncbi:MAG: carbamoyltransferase, partial [Lachnospiraceae bacterium]|nr:carbamoyltransferase [Lachnospiraceae bacterium]
MKVLGISALYHDAAAALVIDGEIMAAAQQERFSRIKHDLNFPVDAIRYCLDEAGIGAKDLDIVVFYDNSLYTLDRYLKNILAAGADSRDLIDHSFETMFTDKIWVNNKICELLWEKNQGNYKILTCEHHISHAAAAFYPSPFEKAVILTMDGVGEWATTTIGVGAGNGIQLMEEIKYPHSLGLLYSAFTYFCGFKVNSGDYKFMGLAPYGEPVYEKLIKDKLIDIKEDGSFRLDLEYFDYQYGRTMINSKFENLFGGPRRMPETEITQREMDIAASVQKVLEEIIIRIVAHCKTEYGKDIENLVLAGGVALNCVANGKIKNTGIFRNIWIQPAAGDAGGSLGCALYASYQYGRVERKVDADDSQKASCLGMHYETEEIKKFLDENHYCYEEFAENELFERLAVLLDAGKVIGVFQGRMEFGPRALGNRSIIADARSETMQVKLNQKIKFRESFRPFAPAVLREDVAEYFELEEDSPYMLLVENIREDRRNQTDMRAELRKADYDMLQVVKQKRSDIPAVTHVDYSARIQTVSKEKNKYFYKLLQAFKKRTGYDVLINTSFNVRGEPIVATPQNAYECF